MTTLIESKAKAFGSSKGLALSMVIHGSLVALALYGTSKVVIPPREKVEAHHVLYVATPPPPPKEVFVAPKPLPKVKAPPQAKAPPRPVVLPQQRPRVAAPQPKVAATPALVAPTSIAATIPDIDLKAAATISDVVAPPIAEPVRSGPPGGTAVRSTSDGDVGGGLNSGGNSGKAFDESQVDRTVSVSRAAVPRFPESLRSVNVTGSVTVRFIVSAEGKVEPGSIDILSTPHKLFADAVRTALLNTRYRPAEAGGRPVRQLVEQSFQFKLNQAD